MTATSALVPIDRTLSGKRIAFFTSVFGMGGSEVLVADAMEAAHLAGAKVECWSASGAAIRSLTASRGDRLAVDHNDWPPVPSDRPGGPQAVAAGGPGPVIHARRGGWRQLVPFAVKRWLGFRRDAGLFAVALRRSPPDLLFVNVNGSEAASVGGASCGLPVVNCYHLSYTRSMGGPVERLGDWLARRATIRAGGVTIHTSTTVRDQWSSVFHYPLDRTRVIYNGVDPAVPVDRLDVRTKLGITPGQFAFCAPGRLDPIKGHTHLVAAVARLAERCPELVVLVCGDGDLRAVLEAQAAAAGVSHRVRFLGWRSDLPAVIAACDAVVLPSVASENLSVAVLEGLMAGVPAIVSRVGGMAEAVQDGRTGFVVPPADPQALANAMARLAADPAAARRMGEAAALDAQTRFTRRRMMAEYVDLFATVIGSRR